jgi:hypothetical protein
LALALTARIESGYRFTTPYLVVTPLRCSADDQPQSPELSGAIIVR